MSEHNENSALSEPQQQSQIVDWTQGLLALVKGEPVTELPKDLYIPPEALKVFLETFEGPLDLLLYLIKKQNIDVLDIPIAQITKQYMEYIEVMHSMELELAGEYLVMAATLAEIKSRMLLPKPTNEDGEPEDPRADLVRRLQEYERYKHAAEEIDELSRVDRDIFLGDADKPPMNIEIPHPDVKFEAIVSALREVLARAKLFSHHQIKMEALSIRERMTDLIERLSATSYSRFETLFRAKEGRVGVVVTLIAILELVRNNVLELTQSEAYGPLYVKARQTEPESNNE